MLESRGASFVGDGAFDEVGLCLPLDFVLIRKKSSSWSKFPAKSDEGSLTLFLSLGGDLQIRSMELF